MMSYTSILMELSCPLFLLGSNRKLSFVYLTAYNIFHSINANSFTIGCFPYLCIATSLLWYDDLDQPTKKKKLITAKNEKQKKKTKKNLIKGLILLFLFLQLLLPLRPYFIAYSTGVDPNWSKEGHYFSWRMMLNQEVE